jgi:uncharacterized membrane protein YoaK (UPF0700 family)
MALEIETRIKHLSVLLTLVAGFCDTVTFVAADSLFSAHVTGNFIVFAYDIVHHVEAHAWTKLVSLVAGLLVLTMLVLHERTVFLMQLAAMLVVFAMGLQNAFGRLFAKETYGPTTVMTGNVTQATLDAVAWLRAPAAPAEQGAALRKQLLVLGTFLVGCLAGAIAAKLAGLSVVAGTGALLLAAALGWHRQAQREVSGSVLPS